MFWPGTLALITAGLIGVVVLAATASGEILKLLPVPSPLLKRLLLVAQPAVLLIVLTATGNAVAEGAASRSIIVDWASGSAIVAGAFDAFWLAAILGIACGVAVFLADRVTRPLWATAGGGPDLRRDWTPASLLAGLAYGGITEEVMMRWGLMGLILWGLAGITGTAGDPSAAMAWLAILLSAAIFAAGHLPAAFASGLNGAGFVIRTLALNLVAGILFGWLFWRWNLETAMVAHAGFHVGGALLVLVLRRATPPQKETAPKGGS